MFSHISQFPILRAGRVEPEAFDYGHAQNNNVVYFDGKWHVYWKGLKDLPEKDFANPVAIGLGYITSTFNGYDMEEYSSNPVIDFGTGTWSAPLDIYTNAALTHEGRIGDISAVVFDSKVHLYFNVYDYNDTGTNRVVLMTSTNGISFTVVQEITFDGGNFGATIGPMFVADSKVWMLCGSPKELRSSTNGLAWTSHGTAISLSTDPAAFNYTAMPVGRGYVYGDYAYAAIPGSRDHPDWPEGIGLWRLPVADLGTTDLEWEQCPNNPVILRDPVKGGVWQLNPFVIEDDTYALYNTWGMVGFSNINTTTVNTLRDTPYFGSDSTTFKHIGVAKAKTKFIDDWYSYLIDGDTYKLRVNGNYITVGAGSSVTMEAISTANSEWVATKESGYWLFVSAAYPTLALTVEAGVDYRANGRSLKALAFDDADPTNNYAFHWQLSRIAETGFYVFNRDTSLAISDVATQTTTLNNATNIVSFIKY